MSVDTRAPGRHARPEPVVARHRRPEPTGRHHRPGQHHRTVLTAAPPVPRQHAPAPPLPAAPRPRPTARPTPAPRAAAPRSVAPATTEPVPAVAPAPVVVPASTAPRREPGTARLLVLVPAHDEQADIGATLDSLRAQTLPPDEVVVVADSCTDATVPISRDRGATVIETVDNPHKKAGALNQALARLLPTLDNRDVVLVMDADTVLEPTFLATATRHLDAGWAAVGGTFTGRDGGGLVGMLQRNEYARYQRDVTRRRGKALVLTGTATALRVAALREVVEARESGALPGAAAVYDTRVLTEDNELTLALRHLGRPVIAPAGCAMTTEVMPTWGELYRQRLRWKRGALENLVDYGLTRVTRPYWFRQLWSFLGVLVTTIYLSSLVLAVAVAGSLALHPFWLAVTAVFSLERMVTVRSRGLRQVLLAGLLVVEMPYDVFLQGVHGVALTNALLRRSRKW